MGQWAVGSRTSRRSGNTLVEVLVALVVLGIGLTGVIALFPVGVHRVRNAVLDTRTTLMAKTALDTFQLKRMHNDQALVNWNQYDQVYLAALPSNVDPVAAAAPILDSYATPLNTYGNVYAWLPYSVGLWGPVDPITADPRTLWRYYLSAEADRVPFDVDDYNSDPEANYNGKVENASSDFNWSYPVLIDPWLFDQMAYGLNLFPIGPVGVPRINISTAIATTSPTYLGYYSDPLKWGGSVPAAPYGDVTVATIYEIAGTLPAPPLSPLAKFERDLLKSRWFASLSDITFLDQESLGQTKNPSSRAYLTGNTSLSTPHYFEPTPATPGASFHNEPVPMATAERSYEYTWAAMIQRRLVPDIRDDEVDPTTRQITNPGTPEVGRPNPESRDLAGRLAIMCFYRRNLDNPFTIIEGCFYNGSRKVTLSWPAAGVSTPEIGFGTWLCELSVSRDIPSGACNRHTGVYPRLDGAPIDPDPLTDDYVSFVKRHYRRSFAFYKVLEVVGDPEVGPDGRYYLEVMVDRAARGYPLRYARLVNGNLIIDGADTRPRDVYRIPTWPIFDPRVGGPSNPTYSQQYDDETNVSQAANLGIAVEQYSHYYPVVIFDGLREVFEYDF